MPEMNGQECFLAMKDIQDDVRVILTSGFSRDADLVELRKIGLKEFLRKQYTMSQLIKAIAVALD